MKRASILIVAVGAICGCDGPTKLTAFPDDLVGRWGESPEGCSRGAIHGGLTIEPHRVADGEFGADSQDIVRNADGSVTTTEFWEVPEEGPKELKVRYQPSADGKLLSVTKISAPSQKALPPQVLIRCPDGTR